MGFMYDAGGTPDMSPQPHSAQLPLPGHRVPVPFSGYTYCRELDEVRLTSLLCKVLWHLLRSGSWWTLAQLRERCGGSEAGISARIRDLRKSRFGGFTIQRRRRPGAEKSGLWEYRLAVGLVSREQVDAIFNERTV